MNVYLLIEEVDQSEFTNYDESAEPISSVLGVYEDREKAEREKKRLVEENIVAAGVQNTNPAAYFIEERPVL